MAPSGRRREFHREKYELQSGLCHFVCTYLDVRVQVWRRCIALVGRASDAVHLLHDHITVEPQLGPLRLQLRSPVRHGGHGRRGAAVGAAAGVVLVIASHQTVLREGGGSECEGAILNVSTSNRNTIEIAYYIVS